MQNYCEVMQMYIYKKKVNCDPLGAQYKTWKNHMHVKKCGNQHIQVIR